MFIDSRHCPHCGAAVVKPSAAQLSVLKCPRCKIDMSAVTIGGETMRECDRCLGLWVDARTFDRICADRERQSLVLGGTSPATGHLTAEITEPIRYIACPQCGQLMNRTNFAKCSGVIVDVCKGHGTWFDADELSAIVQFIRDGGLDLSRQKEKHEIEFQLERLRAEQANSDSSNQLLGVSLTVNETRLNGVSYARGLLKFLLK